MREDRCRSRILAPAVAGLLSVFGCAAYAGASITFLTQTRYVEVGASGSVTLPVGQAINAPSTFFGPFDAVATCATPITDNGQMSLLASQHSRINADSIVANGELRRSYVMPDVGFNGTSNQSSVVDVTFQVDVPTPYYMAVTFIDGTLGLDGRLGLRLSHTTGNTNPFASIAYPATTSRTGILDPGTYRIMSTVDCFVSRANFGFSWIFAVPAPSTAPILGAGVLLAARRRRRES